MSVRSPQTLFDLTLDVITKHPKASASQHMAQKRFFKKTLKNYSPLLKGIIWKRLDLWGDHFSFHRPPRQMFFSTCNCLFCRAHILDEATGELSWSCTCISCHPRYYLYRNVPDPDPPELFPHQPKSLLDSSAKEVARCLLKVNFRSARPPVFKLDIPKHLFEKVEILFCEKYFTLGQLYNLFDPKYAHLI
jgi:hypothetical protein